MAYATPMLFTLFVWWFSTGLILYLDKLPRATHRRSLAGASALLAAALLGLFATRNDTSVAGAYGAFLCSVLVWGWQEMAFLMGLITGPRREPCPAGCSEGRRLVAAAQTVLYHELALALSAGTILALTWGGANQVGLWTFSVLWVMRLSAKLNLFLGVRNRSEDFLPEHLRYLETFFKRQSINLLFPVSVAAASIAAVLGWDWVFAHDPGRFESVQVNLVSSLLTLGILEHWFMVVPLPASALWQWMVPSTPPR